MGAITLSQVTPQLAALFDPQAPAGLRCTAVLEGIDPGKIITDDPSAPRWAAVWEAGDGILYTGGELETQTFHALIESLRREGEVLVGYWDPHDAIVSWLPSNPTWWGTSYDFFDRPADGTGLEAYVQLVQAEYTIREIDEKLLERCLWYEDTVRRHGNAKAFLEAGRGMCLMQGEDILCEAYAGKLILGTRELGVITQEAQRGRGLATLTCAHLVQACEHAGERTYWNCATTNLPSVAVARKLGYRTELMFYWQAWSQIGG